MKKVLKNVEPGEVFTMPILRSGQSTEFIKLRGQAAVNVASWAFISAKSLDQNEEVEVIGTVSLKSF